MLVNRKNLRPHLTWILAVVVITAAAIGWYVVEYATARRAPGGSSLPGLVFGTAGALIMLFEFFLWPRKKMRSWRIGTAQAWLRAHIWLGLLTVPLITLHSGFRWGGQLSTVLLALFLIVVASGLFGLALQQFLPRIMLRGVPNETIYSQIDRISEQLCAGAEQWVLATCGRSEEEGYAPRFGGAAGEEKSAFLTVGAVRSAGGVQGMVLQTQVPTAIPDGEILRRFFYDDVSAYLLQGKRARSPLVSSTKAEQIFRDLRTRSDPAAHPTVATLEHLCDQRRQFDLQAKIQFWLHSWLSVHLPLSVSLVVLMFIHVFVALKYW